MLGKLYYTTKEGAESDFLEFNVAIASLILLMWELLEKYMCYLHARLKLERYRNCKIREPARSKT